MSTQDDKQRTRRERIDRLRKRLNDAAFRNDAGLIAVIKGVLDLLEDEL